MNNSQAACIPGGGVYLPVGILIDTCASVYRQEQVIDQWVQALLQRMRQDSDVDRMIRLLAVHYNDSVRPVVDFLPLEQIGERDLNIVDTFGTTDIGGALLYILHRIRKQTAQWIDKGAKVLCPVVIAVCGEYPAPAFDASADELQLFWGRYRLAVKQLRKLATEQQVIFAAALVNDRLPFDISDRGYRIMQHLTQNGARLFRVSPAGVVDMPLGEMLILAQGMPCPVAGSTPWATALEQVLGL